MTDVVRPRARSAPQPPAGRPAHTRRAAAAAIGCAVFVAVYFAARAPVLPAGALNGDLGIQYFLAGQTSDGAVPLRDFAHTWNVGSWYFSAGLYRLASGDPSTWLFLWGTVFGPLLAGLAVVAIGWRLRLRAAWLLALTGGWLALSHVSHSKYAVPTLWVLALLPVGRWATGWRAVTARAAVTGVTFLFHVELAVLLGAGVALYDLLGARDGRLAHRLTRAAAVPAGLLAAFVIQAIVYRWLGVPSAELVRQLFTTAGETVTGFNFGYPLFAPRSFRPKLLPASLAVAFVPLVWRRLSDSTRLVACLHLAQALIAIRRPDATHVDAAVTLLGLLAVLLVHDLVAAADQPVGWRRRRGGTRAVLAAAGSAWFALAMAAGFAVAHLGAIVLLTLVLAGGVAAARREDWPWASAGALLSALALVVVGTFNGARDALARSDDDSQSQAIAAAVAGPLTTCTGGADAVWVVPSPLTLYTQLELDNPTPYTVFWYGFGAEHDRVRALIDRGAIPAILQVNGWPESMQGLVPDIQAGFETCTSLTVDATGDAVTVWVRR